MQRRFLLAFGSQSVSPILSLSPMMRHFPAGFQPEAVVPESEWHSPKACLEMAKQAHAAAVWIGGTEPLFHSAIGEVASALTDAGYYVFLHTRGASLRKRIHEFKPVDHLYFVVEIPPGTERTSEWTNSHGPTVALPAAFEAIRIARLSGFRICGHFTVTETTSVAEVAAHLNGLRPFRLDGIVISSGDRSSRDPSSVGDILAGVRAVIPSAGWNSFSRLVEVSYQRTPQRPAPVFVPGGAGQENSQGTQGACEETV